MELCKQIFSGVVGVTALGIAVKILGSPYMRLYNGLIHHLTPSQAKPEMTAEEISSCFEIIRFEEESNQEDEYHCICGKQICLLFVCQNIESKEEFLVGDKCKDHWTCKKSKIESMQRKLKREELIRTGTPHCPICLHRKKKCHKCPDPKIIEARKFLRCFIIKNIHNFEKSIILAFKPIKFKMPYIKDATQWIKKKEEIKKEWLAKKLRYKYDDKTKIWYLKPI